MYWDNGAKIGPMNSQFLRSVEVYLTTTPPSVFSRAAISSQ